jgi:hypothetical protein
MERERAGRSRTDAVEVAPGRDGVQASGMVSVPGEVIDVCERAGGPEKRGMAAELTVQRVGCARGDEYVEDGMH